MIKMEYEMSYEAYKNDREFSIGVQKACQKIEEILDEEETTQEIPTGLTKLKCDEIINEKKEQLSQILRQIQLRKHYNQRSKVSFDKELMFSKIQLDDQIYMKYGYSKYQLRTAIVKYGIFEEHMEQKKNEQDEQTKELVKFFQRYKNNITTR